MQHVMDRNELFPARPPVDTRPFQIVLDEFFWKNDGRSDVHDYFSLIRELEQDRQSFVASHYAGHSLWASKREHGPWTEEAVTQMHVLTTSAHKWAIAQKAIEQAGLSPVLSSPNGDEHSIHELIKKSRDPSRRYASYVAHQKQPSVENEIQPIPRLSMDTVCWSPSEAEPLEKPQDQLQAVEMIAKLSGNQAATTTGIVATVPVRSNRWGRWIKLYCEVHVAYAIRPLPQEEIAAYVAGNPQVLDVAGGLDLSTPEARSQYVDPEVPMMISYINPLNEHSVLEIAHHNVQDVTLNTFFAGAPKRPIEHLASLAPRIYAHL
jgi:predicted house-cleaning NTP pyrophosphatase (Maf/HAM1 superfamily)